MIPPIYIDLSGVIEEFNFNPSAAQNMIRKAVRDVAGRMAYLWEQEAGKKLKGTRSLYTSNLNLGSKEDFEAHIILTGVLPNMIEQGASAFDMKEGFSKSSKKKEGKKGWYLSIPFRFATSGALGENSGFSEVMPKEIYALVSKLKPEKVTATGQVMQKGQPLLLKDIPAQFAQPKVRSQVENESQVFEAYIHKTSVFAGMKRFEKDYAVASQGQYITFRRVGKMSDANAWIHKGLTAQNFAEKAFELLDVPHEVDMSVDNFLIESL